MAQEITTKNAVGLPLPEGQIRPNDTVTVYSTGTKDKAGTIHVKSGEPMEVHKALAEKLIAAGKATADAPADSAEKAKK